MSRLLLIDDEPELVRNLELGFRSRGFEVDGYTDPVEAVQKFKPRTYGLAVVDVHMPVMLGGMVAESLRGIDPKIMICFITPFDPGTGLFRRRFPSATKFQNSFFILKAVGTNVMVSMVEDMLRPLPRSP